MLRILDDFRDGMFSRVEGAGYFVAALWKLKVACSLFMPSIQFA